MSQCQCQCADCEAAIHARHSVRKYKAQPVPREMIAKCLDHAQLAPSAMGKNPWKYHVVASPEVLKTLNEQTKKPNYGATAVVFFTIPAGKGIPGFEMYDTALATENLCVAAAHFGLGSIILAYDYPTQTTPGIKKLLGIPDADWICPCAVALGYPDDVAPARQRPVDAVFH